MSDKAKLKAEILNLIGTATKLDAQRLESMKRLRETADALIANPTTPPELIAKIEADFAAIREGYARVGELMKATADRYFEVDVDKLLAEGETNA